MDPTMLEELCKRIQHCCATLRRSRNKRNVGSCWPKSLTGFKLCATTGNNIQQHATGCANGRNICPTMLGVVGQQCCVRLHEALGITVFSKCENYKRTPFNKIKVRFTAIDRNGRRNKKDRLAGLFSSRWLDQILA